MLHITFVTYQELETDDQIYQQTMIFVGVFIPEDSFADPELELCFELVCQY